MSVPLVRIHYRRPPDRLKIHEQWLVHDKPGVKVSLARNLSFPEPMLIDGQLAAEPGCDLVWFTFPGAWHDIGRFHDAAGHFTGLYANILTPVDIRPDHVWHTTDLFLDVWVPAAGSASLLDQDEFDEAVERGWVDEATSARAEEEARRLLGAASAGAWPPPIVEEWTLERARGEVGGG